VSVLKEIIANLQSLEELYQQANDPDLRRRAESIKTTRAQFEQEFVKRQPH